MHFFTFSVGLFKIFREWDKKYGTFYKTSVLGVMNTIELANPDDIEVSINGIKYKIDMYIQVGIYALKINNI